MTLDEFHLFWELPKGEVVRTITEPHMTYRVREKDGTVRRLKHINPLAEFSGKEISVDIEEKHYLIHENGKSDVVFVDSQGVKYTEPHDGAGDIWPSPRFVEPRICKTYKEGVEHALSGECVVPVEFENWEDADLFNTRFEAVPYNAPQNLDQAIRWYHGCRKENGKYGKAAKTIQRGTEGENRGRGDQEPTDGQ